MLYYGETMRDSFTEDDLTDHLFDYFSNKIETWEADIGIEHDRIFMGRAFSNIEAFSNMCNFTWGL